MTALMTRTSGRSFRVSEKEGFILWRIESSVEVKEYDREGAVVEGGFDNTKEHLALAEKTDFTGTNRR